MLPWCFTLKIIYRIYSNLSRILIEAVGQNLCYSTMDDFLWHVFVYFIGYALIEMIEKLFHNISAKMTKIWQSYVFKISSKNSEMEIEAMA